MTAGIVADPGATFFAAISQAATDLAMRIRDLIVALRRRQELRRLRESADHRLADIGIDRDDLRAALSEPLWRDPTAALARRMKGQGGHWDGDIFPNAAKGKRRKQCPRPIPADRRRAIPTCPGVPPSMDLERYLAVLDRKS
jgi:uncharacterized protein YjiS (DUF1127 family)